MGGGGGGWSKGCLGALESSREDGNDSKSFKQAKCMTQRRGDWRAGGRAPKGTNMVLLAASEVALAQRGLRTRHVWEHARGGPGAADCECDRGWNRADAVLAENKGAVGAARPQSSPSLLGRGWGPGGWGQGLGECGKGVLGR